MPPSKNGMPPPAEINGPEDLPDLGVLPEIKIVSHSPIVYWWPVWVLGYLFALLSTVRGGPDGDGERLRVEDPSAGPGLIYVAVLLLVIIFTNVRLRGIYSLVTMLAITFVAVTLAWLGWWDAIAEVLPLLEVRMNVGFYLVMSTGLLVAWLLAFFVFDRLTFWRVRPGQIIEQRLVGDAERSYDLRNVLFEKSGEDLFRHVILGLGAGDLKLSLAGARTAELYIPNVLMVDRKVRAIQKLAAVQPDDFLMRPD